MVLPFIAIQDRTPSPGEWDIVIGPQEFDEIADLLLRFEECLEQCRGHGCLYSASLIMYLRGPYPSLTEIKASTALESKYMDVEFIPIIKLLRSVRVNHSIKQSSPCISGFSAVVPWEQAAKNDEASNHVARAENGDNG